MELMVTLLVLAVMILSVMLLNIRERVKKLEERIGHQGHDFAGLGTVVPEQEAVPHETAPVSSAAVPQRRPAVILRDAPPPQPDPVPIAEPETVAAQKPKASAAPVSLGAWEAPVVSAPAAPKSQAGLGLRFEDLFGRKLPIWAGGITLAVAGVLLVKYSIDAGLLSPAVRVVFGLLFGLGLIGGAEAALRAESHVGDPRVRQALSGAGIASLYAAIIAASNLYHLIGPVTAFAGLAAVTALAMGLSLRFGAPTALLGLVGGLAAPALVGEGPPNVPLLSAYLALAIGGLTALSRQQRWMWLSVSALIGGAGWGGLLILTGALDWATSLSLGLLVLLLGVGLPLIAFTGVRAVLFRSVAALVASAQIALLVAKGGFAPLEWGFYLLLAAVLGWLAWREDRFRQLPPVALAVGLLLATLWPLPPMDLFMAVILSLAAIHAGPAMLRLWREGSGMIEAGQIAAVALAGHAIAWLHYPDRSDAWLAMIALAAALLPAAGAFIGWKQEARSKDARFVTLVVAAALLVAEAGYLLLPLWLLPVIVALLAAGLMLLGRAAEDRRVEGAALIFLAGGALALPMTYGVQPRDPGMDEVARLWGADGVAPMGQALLRWGAVAAAALLSAWRTTLRARPAVEAVAVLFAYGAAAQVAPDWSLPVLASLGLFGIVEGSRRMARPIPRASALTAGAIAFLWAVEPLAQWIVAALASVLGEPMLVGDLPLPLDVVTRLAIPAIIALLALWRTGPVEHKQLRTLALVIAGEILLVAVHCLYKRVFHIDDGGDLIRLGLAERTVWEGLLLGGAVALWRWRGPGWAALACAAAALLHGLWYSVILLNPLLTPVAVGPLPVVNLLTAAFLVLFGALWLIERAVPAGQAATARGADLLRMILIVLFAYATLRQLFCGTLLVGTPVGSVENIGWSVLGIALAIGFLIWGIRSGRHDWRIGSLILMLAAAAKVFLLDAAGLEGLLRIVSFLALGFSLIGIGWLYSRFLRSDAG